MPVKFWGGWVEDAAYVFSFLNVAYATTQKENASNKGLFFLNSDFDF